MTVVRHPPVPPRRPKRAVRVELEPEVLEALEIEAESRSTTASRLIAMVARDHVTGA